MYVFLSPSIFVSLFLFSPTLPILARVQAGACVLSEPPFSLSTRQHLEEEAALSLWTGSGKTRQSKWKLQRRGKKGERRGRKNMTQRRCTDDKSLHWGVLWNEEAADGERETGRRGMGHRQACRMFFEEKQLRDGIHTLLPTGWLFCKSSSNRLTDCTAHWADVAHIRLDGWMHNSLVFT